MKTKAKTTKKPPSDEAAALRLTVVSLKEKLKETELAKQNIETKYQYLLEQFKLAQHLRFAKKSEKDPQQYSLFDEAGVEPAADDTAIENNNSADSIEVPAHSRKKRNTRPNLPADLPREDIIIDVPEEDKVCPCCDKQRPLIGEEITEKLDIEPIKLKVICYKRPKYGSCSCGDLAGDGVVIAPMPVVFLPKSVATPKLASFTIVSKFEDHLPFYRQSKMWSRYSIQLTRGLLGRMVLNSMVYCEPLRELLRLRIIRYHYVGADETTLQVLNEPKRENSQKSYMWCYRGGPPDKPTIVFEYQPGRSGNYAKTFLAGFSGHLQCDGYSGYHWTAAMPTITRGGCMAHARRKFHDVVKVSQQKGLAQEAIDIIAKLYAVEKKSREFNENAEQRFKRRQKDAKPVIDNLKAFLDKHIDQVPPKSKLGEAFRYAINQWSYLIIYLENGEYEIDNNRVENLIRPFVIGKKNWLFHGSPEGAKAGALCYSLIATAKAQGLEPFDYLTYLFTHIPHCKTTEDYEALLPHNLTVEIIKSL